jgi:glycosyltransferase involved in cell wall biosynthesis
MKPTISVVFVVFQTGDQANGGVESITQIIENLPDSKCTVITQITTPINQRWKNAGADVHVWPLGYKMGTPFPKGFIQGFQRFNSLVITNYKIWKLLKATDSKLVHCNDPCAFWHTALGAKFNRTKVIFNIRDIKPKTEKYSLKWKVFFDLSDYQLVLSKEMRQSLIERLSISVKSQSKLKYIYSIVDELNFYPISQEERQTLRQELDIETDTFAIGYVANCNAKKQQLDFLKSAGKLIKEKLPSSKIYFLGDFNPKVNPYAEKCLETVNSNNLQDICVFKSFQPNISVWYKALDLVVVPTKNEGLARCMIESLACSVPVISFDVCSAKEILEENNCGFSVPQGNYEELVNKVLCLVSDKTLYFSLSQNAVETANNLFSISSVIEEYMSFYQEVMDCG